MIEIICMCIYDSTHLLSVLQGYPEGSHYSEHEGLSSPFISSGVAGKVALIFLKKNHNFNVLTTIT